MDGLCHMPCACVGVGGVGVGGVGVGGVGEGCHDISIYQYVMT